MASSWNLFKANWKLLSAITLIPTATLLIARTIATQGSIVVLIGLILAIAGGVASIAMQPALITAIDKKSKDPAAPLTVKGQYSIGFSLFWPMLGLCILEGIFIGLGFIALIIPGIILAVYLCFYSYSRILDDKRGMDAFKDSYGLVKGRWWEVCGRGLFLGLIYIVVGIIISGAAYLLTGGISDPKSETLQVVSGILNLIESAILGPVAAGYMYYMYSSLRSLRQNAPVVAEKIQSN